VPWIKIKGIHLRDADLYFLTTTSGYYIPRGAFGSPEQATVFMNAALAARRGDDSLLRTLDEAIVERPVIPTPSDVWPPPPAVAKPGFSRIDVHASIEDARRLKRSFKVFLAFMLAILAFMFLSLMAIRSKFVTSMPWPARLHVDEGFMVVSLVLFVGVSFMMERFIKSVRRK
jgi:hypothetical protein